MSIKIMSWVWENNHTSGSERLVLLALADSANDQGICWPSVSTLAKKANQSKRYTQEILAKLEEKGLIRKHERKTGDINQSNVYQIMMNPASVVSLESPGDEPEFIPPSEPGLMGVVNQGSSRTVIEPSFKEPLSNRKSADANFYPIAEALAFVTGMDFQINKPRLFREAKLLNKPADQIRADYGKGGAWYRCDWRGLKGQPPTLSQIRETWGNLKPPNGHSKSAEPPIPEVSPEELEARRRAFEAAPNCAR